MAEYQRDARGAKSTLQLYLTRSFGGVSLPSLSPERGTDTSPRGKLVRERRPGSHSQKTALPCKGNAVKDFSSVDEVFAKCLFLLMPEALKRLAGG